MGTKSTNTATPIKKHGAAHIISVTESAGDKLMHRFEETGDLRVIASAMSAYNTGIRASRAQLIYKKMTGRPGTISFFED